MKLFSENLINFSIISIFLCGEIFGLSGPCDDFYEYACANYSLYNYDNNYGEITQKLDFELNKMLLHYLQNTFLHQLNYAKTQTTYFHKVGIYFQSCLHEKQRNISNYFVQLKPGNELNWPLWEKREEWLTSKQDFDFWSLLGQLQSFAWNNIIINQQIIRNKDNSLDVLLMPAAVEEKDSLPQDVILEILLKSLNVNETGPIVRQLRNTDLKWRNMISGINNGATNQTEPSYAEFTLKELHATYPHLLKFLKALLNQQIDNISTIAVENLEYFDFLHRKNWSRQELHELCNYLMLKFSVYLVMDSTASFTSLDCVKDLRKKFDLALNYLSYFHLFVFNEGDKYEKALRSLELKIRLTMQHYFDANFLKLSSGAVQHLKAKLMAIKLNIGNLPDNVDYKFLQQFHQDIPSLYRYNYYRNHLLLLQHRFRNTLTYRQNQSFFIVTDNSLGGQSAPFYAAELNKAVIPIASFQEPFFHYNHSLLKQMSLLGFVLAHEFTHAIDLNSFNYDSQESITANANFGKALNCLLQQEATEEINERLADLFALRVAFKSYFECFHEEHNRDQNRNCYETKGFNEGKEFFLSLAQFFCGKKNLQFVEHDADKIRLNFIVKNFQPFAQIFQCRKNAAMNPKEKCRIY